MAKKAKEKSGRGKKERTGKKAGAVSLRTEVMNTDPDDIRSGISFGLLILEPIARRTSNKIDDTLVNFLRLAAEPGMIEKFMEVFETED